MTMTRRIVCLSIALLASTGAPVSSLCASVEPEYNDAVTAFRSGNYDQARLILQRLVTEQPGSAEAHHLLGLVEATGGRQSEAVVHLETAVRLEPERSDYTINLAKLYARMDQKQSAVRVLSQFLAVKPTADVADALGLMRLTSGDWPGSAQNFQTATELEPARLIAWYHLGLVHRAMGDFDSALSDFDHALAIASQDFPSLLASGAISLQRGNLTEAESKFWKAEQIRPDSADVQRLLSDVALRKGDLQTALELGRRATKLAPHSGAAHYQLARVLMRVHRKQEADREFAAFRDSPPEGNATVDEYWQTSSQQQAQPIATQP